MKHLDNYTGPEPSNRMSDVLARRGGKNAMGFPIYRMVKSEFITEKIGGTWHDWDENLSIEDRGGIDSSQGRPILSHHRPDQIVTEVREVQKYSHLEDPGWILERWYPASMFGARGAWESIFVLVADPLTGGEIETNVPRLGPYPHQGQYEMIVGPFPAEPSIDFVEDFIASWEQRRDSFPSDIEEHIKMRIAEAVKQDEEASAHAIQTNRLRLRDSAAPLTSTTLEAGRWRQKMFEKSGHTSHIGN
jgi:hypothetical protein